MFEWFVVIACAIFAGLATYSAIWLALLMNKKFIKSYLRAIMEATNEAMANEIEKATEQEIERIRWTEF